MKYLMLEANAKTCQVVTNDANTSTAVILRPEDPQMEHDFRKRDDLQGMSRGDLAKDYGADPKALSKVVEFVTRNGPTVEYFDRESCTITRVGTSVAVSKA